jgi:hypothetical protein
VDGLDRIDADQVKKFYERASDIARPRVRMVITAPEIMQATLAFSEIKEFFTPRLIPNVSCEEQNEFYFLSQLVARRLTLCDRVVENVFETGVLESLIYSSGGNTRDLVSLIHLAGEEAEVMDQMKIDSALARKAEAELRKNYKYAVRDNSNELLRNFQSKAPQERLPPEGELGDHLLRSKCILMYETGDDIRFALHPLLMLTPEEEKKP